jgi:hypothetical protein
MLTEYATGSIVFYSGILFDLRRRRVAVITLEDLKIAFAKTLGEKGLAQDMTDEWAETIISLFGFDHAVIDNRLAPKERDIFYKLEEEGLVYTKQEEVSLRKGKVWRLHYWFLNAKKILKLSRGEEEHEAKDPYAVYAEGDEEMWTRHPKS